MVHVGREYVCRAMYRTPLGYIYDDIRGGTPQKAMEQARERGVFGLVSLESTEMWVEIDGVRVDKGIDLARCVADGERDQVPDEAAEGGGDEPAEADEGVLGPEPVAPGEHEEAPGDGGALPVAGKVVGRPVGLGDRRLVRDLVFLLGKRDEVKILKLGKHRLLVDGRVDVLGLEGPFEVANLARVLADSPEVCGEVGRD